MRRLLTNRFTGKAPLKAYIQSQSDGVGRNIQLARDRDETGKKTYHYVPVDAVDTLRELLTTNTHLYELIPPDVPVKLFFDLEQILVTHAQKQFILAAFRQDRLH